MNDRGDKASISVVTEKQTLHTWPKVHGEHRVSVSFTFVRCAPPHFWKDGTAVAWRGYPPVNT